VTPTKFEGIVKVATDRYNIRVRATDPRTGKRKEVERVRDCTLTEARAVQNEWRDELVASLTAERPAQVRLRDFVTSWLTGRKGEIKQSTAEKLALVWDMHISPERIADLFVDEISIEDVEEWLAALRLKTYVPGKGKASGRRTRSEKSKARPLSAGTIKGYFRVLSQILGEACARARVTNPCDALRAPKPGKRRKNFLAIDEVGKVLAYVREKHPAWYEAVLLDIVSGLRWGELSALRWDDVDEQAGVIRIVRGNVKGRVERSTKTGDDEDEPKLVPLLPEVQEALRARRQQMIRDQHPGIEHGWIFPTVKGKLHKGSPLRKVLDAACLACGTKRRVTPHGLRHTANDLLRRVTDGEVVRAIIGHSTTAMTHHYSHVDENEKRLAVTRVLAVVRGDEGGKDGGTDRKTAAPAENPETQNPAVTRGSAGGATQI
jgi:integrase